MPVADTTKIDPDKAVELLENNTYNRNLRQKIVERYANIMKKGEWRLNGETIIISKSGRVLDGQHRLWAVIESGVTIETAIVYGVDENYFATIDTGQAKKPADMFKIAGIKEPQLTSTAIMWIYMYVNEKVMVKESCTAEHAIELFREFPDVEDSICFARPCGKFLPKGTGTALHYLFAMVDKKLANAFFEAIGTGEFETGQSPIRAFRERLINDILKNGKPTTKPVDRYAMAIKAWNAYYEGRQIRVVRFSSNEKFPKISGLDVKRLKKFKETRRLKASKTIREAAEYSRKLERTNR
jgi:hypothetical protein